ncbi:hypothetical protein M514_08624 [Trichuris suis]|uniref:Uncharacterized protein n=1 Tax=Trichuris suis TaxID=68888 RepID=A0A085M010_9BILA|nr:hypothetical protein M513_08624 [Trichuris suis]KFD61151.1 hypothetical protein M514_08624 [Trichuris suis]
MVEGFGNCPDSTSVAKCMDHQLRRSTRMRTYQLGLLNSSFTQQCSITKVLQGDVWTPQRAASCFVVSDVPIIMILHLEIHSFGDRQRCLKLALSCQTSQAGRTPGTGSSSLSCTARISSSNDVVSGFTGAMASFTIQYSSGPA